MVRAKKFIVKQHFQGEPKPTDLEIIEEELPPLEDGEFLAQAEYLSVDPYMRKLADQLPLGATMLGGQVARIVESSCPDYPVGRLIYGYMGWRSHTIMRPGNFEAYSLSGRQPHLVPDYGHLSASLWLGVLGQPGMTAYMGLRELCEPKPGETLVVSGAAGAVGSLVGQMGKILGLKVIGIAGSTEKCRWIVEELGFDAAIDYKSEDVAAALRKAAPNGVDCYFDNVGGEISSSVIRQMRPFGRVAVCGSVSSYNCPDPPKCTIIQPAVVSNQLVVRGFLVSRWKERREEVVESIRGWIERGELRHRETVTHGFERMLEAFVGMLRGENFGKAVVKA